MYYDTIPKWLFLNDTIVCLVDHKCQDQEIPTDELDVETALPLFFYFLPDWRIKFCDAFYLCRLACLSARLPQICLKFYEIFGRDWPWERKLYVGFGVIWICIRIQKFISTFCNTAKVSVGLYLYMGCFKKVSPF